jgi:hypothetical protein
MLLLLTPLLLKVINEMRREWTPRGRTSFNALALSSMNACGDRREKRESQTR